MKSVLVAIGFSLVVSSAFAYPLNTYPSGTTVAQYRAAEAQTKRVNGDRNPVQIKDPSAFIVTSLRAFGDTTGSW